MTEIEKLAAKIKRQNGLLTFQDGKKLHVFLTGGYGPDLIKALTAKIGAEIAKEIIDTFRAKQGY